MTTTTTQDRTDTAEQVSAMVDSTFPPQYRAAAKIYLAGWAMDQTVDARRALEQEIIDRVMTAAAAGGWCTDAEGALTRLLGEDHPSCAERRAGDGRRVWLMSDGFARDGLDREGRTRDGYDRDGYDRDGFNRNGYDRDGFNREGFDYDGFGRDGIHPETGLSKWRFDRDGYDRDGFSYQGTNRTGYSRARIESMSEEAQLMYHGRVIKSQG